MSPQGNSKNSSLKLRIEKGTTWLPKTLIKEYLVDLPNLSTVPFTSSRVVEGISECESWDSSRDGVDDRIVHLTNNLE